MSTILVCTECDNPIDVIGDSVTLPFVCNQCQAEAEEFQKKIAPKPVVFGPVAGDDHYVPDPAGAFEHDGDPGDEHEHVHNGGDFDATNQLIADLTQSLESSNETTKSLTETVKDLTQRLSEAGELIDDLNRQLESEQRITDRVIEVNDELHKKVEAAFVSRNVYRDAYFKMGNRVKELTGQNSEAERELTRANARADEFAHFCSLKNLELNFYQTRGFWARLFNARYKAAGQF